MTENKAKKGLGKGLSALLPNLEKESFTEGIQQIAIEQIFANPNQPRKSFDGEKLAELAASLKEHGMVQPLIVVPQADNQFMIVAGERRYRASKMAGLKELPCFVRKLSSVEIMEISLIENIQRENLNAWEEAESYQALQKEIGYTQEQLAQRLGKSRPYVANTLRLLSLDEYCAELLRSGQLSAGHARALLAVEGDYSRRVLAGRIVHEQLSVRETEQLAKDAGKIQLKKTKRRIKKNATINTIEKQLRHKFGTKVNVLAGENGGQIILDYYTEEDLTRLVELLLPEVDF